MAAETSRTNSCGNANSGVGKAATQTVVATIACLCASDSANGGNNACFYEKATAAQAFDGTADEIQGWQTILTECNAVHPNYQKLGYTQLPSIITAVRAELYAAKGSGVNKIGILGAIQGGGSGACDGDHVSNNGECASFRTGANKVTLPTWMTVLADAIAEAEQQKTKTKKATPAGAQVHTLNETLTTLLNLNAMEDLKQPTASPTQAAKTPSGDSKKQQEEVEEKCNNIDKEPDCNQHKNPKCTWDGEAKRPKKKCTLSETGKQTAAKEAENQEGKDGKSDCSARIRNFVRQ
uniref:Variant surface glycoprotein 1125.5507 n=1 Tax=Trypanosoma brucei TaxID=5691 RepID=A0A1J0RCM7_9TRYP|nr:variant surface glycoprotein 1125.5507 [Trypanosoma brucei]